MFWSNNNQGWASSWTTAPLEYETISVVNRSKNKVKVASHMSPGHSVFLFVRKLTQSKACKSTQVLHLGHQGTAMTQLIGYQFQEIEWPFACIKIKASLMINTCNGFSVLQGKLQRHKGANVQTSKISGTYHGMFMSSRMMKPNNTAC